MIKISKSETADTRTCDYANTSKEILLNSSRTHIRDVVKALSFFTGKLIEASGEHDYDKLTDIDWFHKDFVTGFKQTGWWDNHRKIHRHHLAQEDGVPIDVNLIDVLEYIADCVMAGMARSGKVYDLEMPPELLERAFKNTVKLLKAEVVVSNVNKKSSMIQHPISLKIEPILSSDISMVINKMLNVSKKISIPVSCDFNGQLVMIFPEDNYDKAMENYYKDRNKK